VALILGMFPDERKRRKRAAAPQEYKFVTCDALIIQRVMRSNKIPAPHAA
jgi:hypothetical protein